VTNRSIARVLVLTLMTPQQPLYAVVKTGKVNVVNMAIHVHVQEFKVSHCSLSIKYSTVMETSQEVIALYRPRLERLGVLRSVELERKRNGEKVRVAGLVVVRQRPPTAKGFVFITLEDEEGLVNVIVRPDVYDQYYRTMRNSLLLIVEGAIQKQSRAFSTSWPRGRWG
jgi:DNA polymerase III alpha subunit